MFLFMFASFFLVGFGYILLIWGFFELFLLKWTEILVLFDVHHYFLGGFLLSLLVLF